MRRKFEGYLMVSDMDGTLLNSKGKLSEENIEAINYFRENGGVFTIATGRMLPSAERFIKKLNIDIPVILYNGSKIYDYNKNNVIYESFLVDEDKEIIKKIKEYNENLGIEVYSEESIYLYGSNRYTSRLSQKGYIVTAGINESQWQKKWTKILILGEEEEIDSLEAILRGKYINTNFIRSGKGFLEICPYGDSKGQALNILLEKYNYSKEKIIAIGDNMNDLELLTGVKFGFVVSNGNKKLLEMVSYKTLSNDKSVIKDVIKVVENVIKKY